MCTPPSADLADLFIVLNEHLEVGPKTKPTTAVPTFAKIPFKIFIIDGSHISEAG
jgi:hypothetical protein